MDYSTVYSFNMHSAYGHIDLPNSSIIRAISLSKTPGLQEEMKHNQIPRN
jgi:hypothetical protein